MGTLRRLGKILGGGVLINVFDMAASSDSSLATAEASHCNLKLQLLVKEKLNISALERDPCR